MKEVSTSFLSNESSKDLIKKINETKTNYIHFDVMDGKFTENKFLSIKELEEFLKLSKKNNDVHLMVKDPSKYIKVLSSYNISYLTVHYEIKNVEKYIDMIKSCGIKVGVSINPDTDIENIFPLLDKVNLVLVMSVYPGKSGQKFIEEVVDKITKLKQEIINRKLNVKISIDGGICEEVLKHLNAVDIVVSSSYVLSDFNNIEKIQGL